MSISMVTISTIASIGSLLGDTARVNMMTCLVSGRAMTAGELAARAGITPQTASNHLSKLVEAGLLIVERQGRFRYHRIASDQVANLIEQMHVAGASIGHAKRRKYNPTETALRELRTCYDHLAGRIAVQISGTLIDLSAPIGVTHLKEGASSILSQIGIDVVALIGGSRPACRACLDWSERRPHVAGSVGAALLKRASELGWIVHRDQGRALSLTRSGEKALWEIFSVRAASGCWSL